MLRKVTLLGLVGLLACGGNGGGRSDAGNDGGVDAGVDLADRLAAIPGMTVSEQPSPLHGYRYFILTFDQLADHRAPNGQHFAQRMVLLSRDEAAPMVLFLSGYQVTLAPYRAELTRALNANQLSVEHRYFAVSRPEPTDWSQLTIEQAANDDHLIVQALKAIYPGRWLSTGQSKGGMAAVFHRRFYPDDVDGTVAYSAPLTLPGDQLQGPGNRYIAFLDTVGSDSCRQDLSDFQNLVLSRRSEMIAALDQQTPAGSWTILGEDRALDFMVEDTPFVFWQYGDSSLCAQIPTSASASPAVFAFLDRIVGTALYADNEVLVELPYYYQAATQLGYPAADESTLVGLVHPGENTARAYIPASVPTASYDDGAAATDIQSWVSTSGSRLLFVYGETDPWSAGAFQLGSASDSFKLVVSGGNHVSPLAALAPADLAIALDAIGRWTLTTPALARLPDGRSEPELNKPEPGWPQRLRR